MKKELKWLDVDSSAMKRVAYNSSTRELFVEFRPGTYAYLGVPSWTFYRLVHADSVGTYFNREILPKYEAVRK